MNSSPHDTTRWSQIVISKRCSPGSERGHITSGTSHFKPLSFKLDSTMHLSITPKYHSDQIYFSGHVEQRTADEFLWKGTSGSDTLELLLRRNEREFTLDKRNFMWIMETKDFY